MNRLVTGALGQIGARALPILAAGFAVGLAFQDLAGRAYALITPSIFIPLVLSLMRLDVAALRVHARRPLLGAAVVGWALIACPVLVAGTGALLSFPARILTPLVIMAGAPPLMSAPALALLVGLDAELTTLLVLAGTAVAPLTIPSVIALLAGGGLEISATALGGRFLGFIGAAFVAAIVLRRLFGAAPIAKAGRALDGVSVLCLLVFLVAIMRGVPGIFRTDPRYALTVTVAVFALNLCFLGAAAAVFWRAGPREALSIGLVSANRNIGIMAAILADRMPQEVMFFVAMGQLPMFLLPPVLVRLVRAASPRAHP